MIISNIVQFTFLRLFHETINKRFTNKRHCNARDRQHNIQPQSQLEMNSTSSSLHTERKRKINVMFSFYSDFTVFLYSYESSLLLPKAATVGRHLETIYAWSDNVVWGAIWMVWCNCGASGGTQRPNWAPYRIPVSLLNFVTMRKALYSSALTWLVNGRWRREVLYKHKLTSLTTALHCSAKLKVWTPWLLQRLYHCKCCTANADVWLTMQRLLGSQRRWMQQCHIYSV
jgi:hypothetical protein